MSMARYRIEASSPQAHLLSFVLCLNVRVKRIVVHFKLNAATANLSVPTAFNLALGITVCLAICTDCGLPRRNL
jgi:hypothetical protein